MSKKAFTRFVLFPNGSPGMSARNLAVCFRSIANELEKLGDTKALDVQIDEKEKKLIVFLEGEDPQPRFEFSGRKR